MPTSRKTTKAAMAAAAAMPSIPKALIDQFVTGSMTARVKLLVASSSGQRPTIAARDCSADHLRSFWVEGDSGDVRPVARGP